MSVDTRRLIFCELVEIVCNARLCVTRSVSAGRPLIPSLTRRVTMCAAGLMCVLLGHAVPADETPGQASEAPQAQLEEGPQAATERRQLYRGRVVLLEDALKRRGLHVAEEMAAQAVLETDDGEIIPLLADWRGRAFFQDARLRDRPVELVAYRRPQLPYLHVLMVFTFDENGTRMYTDYWCDICSIPMYEIQPCECCQGEIRLRFQEQDLPAYLDELQIAN